MTKLFLELEFRHKGNEQTKKGLIVSKLLQFSRLEWIQKMKLFKCYTEKGKSKNWTDLSLSGQEPTFKTFNLSKKTYKNLYFDEKTLILANFLKCST